MPGLAVHNTRQIGKLACWAVRAINQTSTTIALLNQEQRELRSAILSNRAAIDYLFLKHHMGCEAIQQICCFNLTDNYHSIETHLHNLHEMVQEVKESDGFGVSIKGAWDKLGGYVVMAPRFWSRVQVVKKCVDFNYDYSHVNGWNLLLYSMFTRVMQNNENV